MAGGKYAAEADAAMKAMGVQGGQDIGPAAQMNMKGTPLAQDDPRLGNQRLLGFMEAIADGMPLTEELLVEAAQRLGLDPEALVEVVDEVTDSKSGEKGAQGRATNTGAAHPATSGFNAILRSNPNSNSAGYSSALSGFDERGYNPRNLS